MVKNTTTKQAVNAFLAISNLIDADRASKIGLSAVARLKLASTFLLCKTVYEEYMKQKDDLIKSYGVPFPSKPDSFMVPDDKKQDFITQNSEMLDSETNFKISPIPVDKLGNAEIDIGLAAELKDAGVIE
jgi:hypothetical protein